MRCAGPNGKLVRRDLRAASTWRRDLLIKYLGSKRLLIPAIRRIVAAVPGVATVADPFSGTSRVGHALKADGLRVFANDHNRYAATLARCYVQADRERHTRAAS